MKLIVERVKANSARWAYIAKATIRQNKISKIKKQIEKLLKGKDDGNSNRKICQTKKGC